MKSVAQVNTLLASRQFPKKRVDAQLTKKRSPGRLCLELELEVATDGFADIIFTKAYLKVHGFDIMLGCRADVNHINHPPNLYLDSRPQARAVIRNPHLRTYGFLLARRRRPSC